MIQNPNPTDYPHLEAFIDWLYEHVEELPSDPETLIARVQHWTPKERDEDMRRSVDQFIENTTIAEANPETVVTPCTKISTKTS